MLKINNLTKSYGEKKAVNALTLEISRGEICAFIGHNGAGKTTTLKACIGVLDFDEGEIFIDGVSVKENPMYTKSVTAYIPDNPDLYEYLTGIKYLNFITVMQMTATSSLVVICHLKWKIKVTYVIIPVFFSDYGLRMPIVLAL